MEITTIKNQLTLAQVLDHYHLKPDKQLRLNCPFHDDKTPSLQVYYKTQTCYCFSSNCSTGGKSMDVIDFIMNKEQLSKHEAIKKAESLITGTATPGQELSRIAVLTKMFTYFKNGLYNSKPGQNYLTTRSLNREKIEVGFNSGQFHHGSRKDQALIESCIKYGLLLDRGHVNNRTGEKAYSPFGKSCIVFALRNQQHQITGLYFRSTTNDKDQRHFYLKDRQGLYPNYPSPETKKLILTESIIDAATLLQLNLKGYEVLALFGTNGFTSEHTKVIKDLQELEEIIFFLNGDEPGRKATEKYTKDLQQLKPEIKLSTVEVPEGEDVNSLAVNHPDQEKEVLEHLIMSQRDSTKESDPPNLRVHNLEAEPKLNVDNPERIIYKNNSLTGTVWGGIEKENLSRLKISLHIKSDGKSFRDDVNLYSHAAVKKLIQNVSETLEISTTQTTDTIADLTEKLEAYRMEERAAQIKALKPKAYEMTDQEKQQAEKFLQSPDLVKNTLNLISQSGLIGEQKNGLLLFFLYLSRFFDEPLHAIIFGRSGSGKTYLQTKVSDCLPEESVRTITSLTENTLYYSSRDFWKHKVLMIEDLDGVYNAFLPLREFMSKQSITKLTTDKDAKGNNVQKVLTVEGPICVSGATTKEGIYEDNANRSYLLHINEGADHMEEVMDYQRKLQAGMVNEESQHIAKQLLKNTQRILQPIKVINPYATQLKIPDSVFKKLRTNMHYLRLIEIITFYHQWQRPQRINGKNQAYIETTLEDISWANRLVKESLLRKSDELNGQLRSFFERLKSTIEKQEEKTFYSKQIREQFRMNPMKTNRYLRELDQWGYIKKVGGNRKIGFEYEIAAWDEYQHLQSGIDVLDQTLQKLRDQEAKKESKINGTPLSVTQV
ncbi:CHC2 zinc finger domain-containing protein [Reichenbachiella carrageenanivorans]|uniref:CHC2 zinc finger domain-containing protein n=1 Tax=Reichenbachiella carrageenanivorans TaxID=2979869 RepID=A0ABY6CZX5_9BACT|nr:CHC2 zinc finger domain-containing protein [Reichenbachiella carrageenanivorans]UXX79437.1 CHC2 zinc finger domain-containing protein [Reichenbachiella carrageenanivorans]UXX79443.1 CHC2 zinc finger domain-containing protein [Reichenbachiella carrageenanivorans]